jgi:uncharacterized membrane protein YedE/YeeE
VFAFSLAKKRSLSFLGADLRVPDHEVIDRRLVLGSLLFGAGWGLAGFCPGPALVSMAAGQSKAIWFVVFMLIGMLIFEVRERRAQAAQLLEARGTTGLLHKP